MAQLDNNLTNLKYLDLQGLQTFWDEAKLYIENKDQAIIGKEEDSAGTLTLNGLKKAIDNVSAGTLTVPVATATKIGGVLSAGDISVATGGQVTVNNASQAQKLANAQTLDFQGGITGTVTFDGTSTSTLTVNTVVDPTQHIHEISQVTNLENSLNSKLPINDGTANNLTVNGLIAANGSNVNLSEATINLGENALATTFSETVAQSKDQSTVATIGFVKAVVESKISSSQAMIYKGIINFASELEAIKQPRIGWTYKVNSLIDFTNVDYINNTDKVARPGDLIVCQTGGATGKDAKWDIVVHNEDGQVYGPESSVIGNLVVFDNSVGDHVTDSGESIISLKNYTDTAKNSVIGNKDTDTKDSNTVIGAKKYADDIVNASKVVSVAITADGEGVPYGSIGNNVLSLYLPKYALDSKVTTLEGNITSVSEKVASIEKLTTGLDPDTPISEVITEKVETAKKEALGAVALLEDRVDDIDAVVSENEDKLSDVETTVGNAIQNYLSKLISVPVENIPTTTLTAYTAEELSTGMEGWFN